MTATLQVLRELIRVHVTGPAVELAEIEADTRLSEDLDYGQAIDLAYGVWQRFRVDIPAPRIPGKTVAELVALIEQAAGDRTAA